MELNKVTISFVIVIITLILIFSLLVPKYKEFKSLQLALAKKQAEFNVKYNYYSQVSQTYRNLQDYSVSLKKIDSALPSDASFGDIIYFFQNKSTENGLVIKQLFLIKSVLLNPESKIKEVSFSINIMGSYSAFKNFIHSIEKSSRLFEIPRISFNAPLTFSSAGYLASSQKYIFTVEIKTYSY